MSILTRISTPLIMPQGELCDQAIICEDKSGLYLVGRLRKQPNESKAIEINYLTRLPVIGLTTITSFEKRSASGAYGKFIESSVGNYPSQVWEEFNPLLMEVGL